MLQPLLARAGLRAALAHRAWSSAAAPATPVILKVFLDPVLVAHMRRLDRKSPARRMRVVASDLAQTGGVAGIEARARAHFHLDTPTAPATLLRSACGSVVDDSRLRDLAAAGSRFDLTLAAKDPAQLLPAPLPAYLQDVPPLTGAPWQMLSFYRFFPAAEAKEASVSSSSAGLLEAMVRSSREVWGALGILGRVYFAAEGVNAQMAVPVPVVDRLRVHLADLFGSAVELNLDEVLTAEQWHEQIPPPFTRLAVILRPQVVSDGLAEPLALAHTGTPLSPAEFHARLRALPAGVPVLDVRNVYESDVGRFEHATPLNTRTYKETWPALDRLLEKVDRDTPVLMYCTGGIRCVKAAAYVQDRLHFRQVERLEGGIVAYQRYVDATGQASLFQGRNYVFDHRMATSPRTPAVLGTCGQCGAPTDRLTNCAHQACHERLAQCPACAARLDGCCSHACQASALKALHEANAAYASTVAAHSEPPVLAAMRRATERAMPTGAHMTCSPAMAALLATLVPRPGARVLELGTFTGVSAMAMALLGGAHVTTVDQDQQALALARQLVGRVSRRRALVDILEGDALEVLARLPRDRPFAMVYLDHSKTRYRATLEYLLDNGLLEPNALVLADNALYKGLVASDAGRCDDARRAKTANAVRAFNAWVRQGAPDAAGTQRLRMPTIVPAWDGLLMARVAAGSLPLHPEKADDKEEQRLHEREEMHR